MSKFRAGDLVKISKPNNCNKSPRWVTDMDKFDQKIITVDRIEEVSARSGISKYLCIEDTDDEDDIIKYYFNDDWCTLVDKRVCNNVDNSDYNITYNISLDNLTVENVRNHISASIKLLRELLDKENESSE